MAQSNSQRAIVVTGASTGIGRATALTLDAQGFRVFAGVRRQSDADGLRAVASARLTPLSLDVTDSASIATAVRLVADETAGQGLYALVNNAGVAVAGALEFLPIDKLRQQFEINVVGLVAVTQAFLPQLRATRGRIVHIGSTSGILAMPFIGAYCGSKFAVEGIADSMRRELLPWGISVSVVQPGAIATPIWQKTEQDAEIMLQQLSAYEREHYGTAIVKMKALTAQTTSRAIPAERVAEKVLHALTARRPRLRYPVGLDARIQGWIVRWAPARWVDAVTGWVMRP